MAYFCLYSLDKGELYKIVYILKKYNLDGGTQCYSGALCFLIFIVYKNVPGKLVNRFSKSFSLDFSVI